MATGELSGKPEYWGSSRRSTSIPSRGSSNTSSLFMLRNQDTFHLARVQTSHFYLTLYNGCHASMPTSLTAYHGGKRRDHRLLVVKRACSSTVTFESLNCSSFISYGPDLCWTFGVNKTTLHYTVVKSLNIQAVI